MEVPRQPNACQSCPNTTRARQDSLLSFSAKVIKDTMSLYVINIRIQNSDRSQKWWSNIRSRSFFWKVSDLILKKGSDHNALPLKHYDLVRLNIIWNPEQSFSVKKTNINIFFKFYFFRTVERNIPVGRLCCFIIR